MTTLIVILILAATLLLVHALRIITGDDSAKRSAARALASALEQRIQTTGTVTTPVDWRRDVKIQL